MTLKAPFPWFGGKAKIADEVWRRFGDVTNYVEPFAGSLAVLLARPDRHRRSAETVNDLDRMLCNFWRAVRADPDGVAGYASDPVNESDLFARHMWLVQHGAELIGNLESDPDCYNSKVAGWWVWGICQWIGSGWCSGRGCWYSDGEQPRQLPHLGDAGQGVNRKRPHLGDAGQGVNRQLPHLGSAGQGDRRGRIGAYIHQLAARLQDVRVICGDWARVVTDGALSYGFTNGSGDGIGILFDPPYLYETDGAKRTGDLYNCDSDAVADAVRQRAIELGDAGYRVALCGYEGEHDMPDDWAVVAYKVNRAYGTRDTKGGVNRENRSRERVWFSPACDDPDRKQSTLFK